MSILEVRQRAGYTRARMAARLGVATITLARYEGGYRIAPTPLVKRWARYADIDPATACAMFIAVYRRRV